MAAKIEEPKYIVLQKFDEFEIREYAQHVVAETHVQGPFKESVNEGFKILAPYIFGANQEKKKIQMTAPVSQQLITFDSEASLMQQLEEDSSQTWLITFTMPAQYRLKDLPEPDDERIELKIVPVKKMAVYMFSGLFTEKKALKNTEKLFDLLAQNHFQPVGAPLFARYNPPWTLPFLRRNEIIIQVE